MGVSYLLDTHAFVWLVQEDGPRVPAAVSDALTRADHLYVSSISALEIATKVRRGKLPGAEPLVAGWSSARRRIGAQTLAVTEPQALLAGSLEWDHRDPFDRMLVAQALTEELLLVTADRLVQHAPGVNTLPWRAAPASVHA